MFAVFGISAAVVLAMLEVQAVMSKELEPFGMVAQNSAPMLSYVLVVMLMEKFYNWAARVLTQMEHHLVYESHAKSLAMKRAGFQLVNNLGWFIYVAFWKQDM